MDGWRQARPKPEAPGRQAREPLNNFPFPALYRFSATLFSCCGGFCGMGVDFGGFRDGFLGFAGLPPPFCALKAQVCLAGSTACF